MKPVVCYLTNPIILESTVNSLHTSHFELSFAIYEIITELLYLSNRTDWIGDIHEMNTFMLAWLRINAARGFLKIEIAWEAPANGEMKTVSSKYTPI